MSCPNGTAKRNLRVSNEYREVSEPGNYFASTIEVQPLLLVSEKLHDAAVVDFSPVPIHPYCR